ncbi:MAG: CvpA family protein [Alphaproteobacteria bacterium]|nr:CvpA family protein [Alphaproteobacteria bacterium]
MTALALDIAIGFVILLSTVAAYFRGFVKEVFTLIGITVAVFFAYKFGHLLVPEFNQWLHVPAEGDKAKVELIWGLLSPAMASKVAAYGGTFLLVFVVMTLTGYFLSRWIKETGLGIVDRLLGGAFGFLRGFLLVFLIYVPSTYLIDQKKLPEWTKESFSLPILQSTLAWTTRTFELDKKIEDQGSGIAIKLDKIDIDKLGGDVRSQAEEELKAAIEREEKETQKMAPEAPPSEPLNEPEGGEPVPDPAAAPSLP